MRVSALLQEYRFEFASAGVLIAIVVAAFVLRAWLPHEAPRPFDTCFTFE